MAWSVAQPGAVTGVALQRSGELGELPVVGAEEAPPRRHRPFMIRYKWAIPITSLIVFLSIWQLIGSRIEPAAVRYTLGGRFGGG